MPSVFATVLYGAFSLLTALGAYLIGAHFRSRRTGLAAAFGALAFFAALGAAMWALVAGFGPL